MNYCTILYIDGHGDLALCSLVCERNGVSVSRACDRLLYRASPSLHARTIRASYFTANFLIELILVGQARPKKIAHSLAAKSTRHKRYNKLACVRLPTSPITAMFYFINTNAQTSVFIMRQDQ